MASDSATSPATDIDSFSSCASDRSPADRPDVACNDSFEIEAGPQSVLRGAWRPREGASHLVLGPNGIYYFRLAIPEHVRARDPSLPRELKRSTKAASKRLALARARKMCLDRGQLLMATNPLAKYNQVG